MKIALMTICGEADHPLLETFKSYYKPMFDQVIIQMGVTEKWYKVNGDTSLSGNIFTEKVAQQNKALEKVHKDTDYIFTLDVDEFVSYADLQSIMWTLKERPDTCELQMNQFWHLDNYVAYGGDGWGFEAWNPRIFRYVKGMQFTDHRPPTLSYKCEKLIRLTQRGNHYSYSYPLQVKRKMKYYNEIYPHMPYADWFYGCYLPWTPETRVEIESKYSCHPSCPNAKTKLFTGKHEIKWR